VSVVIGLYRRLDLLQHQLSAFAADDELRRSEIILVLDSPELRDVFVRTAAELHDLYRISFRALVLDRSSGYGPANNAGVAEAKGRLVLLCNSDVFPLRPGWLMDMVRFYDATPGIGALGPKLLFEDDTIQHAGLYFAYVPATGTWDNRHYYKGFQRHLPEACVTREVPAVTGACLLIDRTLFQRHGGFSASFVRGDYEDSDLCLRLRAAGLHHWYLSTVELSHLEAQSYNWQERRPMSLYNAWLHSDRWGDTLVAMMREFDDPARFAVL
jgi:GT2 family glycosyltransferase